MARLVSLASVQQLAAINLTADPGAIGGKFVMPNGVQVIIQWGAETGKSPHNVLWGSVSGGFNPTPQIAQNILTALTTGANWTAMAAFMPTTGSLFSVALRDRRVLDQPFVPATGTGLAGTSASAALPNEVAICVTFRTGAVGPANRGRMYIPNFATNALGAGNVIAAAAVTAVQNWASTIAGILAGQGIILSIGHPPRQAYTGSTGTEHPARVAGLVPVITATVRDNHWDSQRRRGLK